MEVTVQLFAAARQRVGRATVTLGLPAEATVAELRRALGAAHPELAGLLACSRIAVGSEYATDDRAVEQADEVALIPPVSGG